MSTTDRVDVELSESVTEAVLTRVPGSFNGGVNDGLLAALALALTKWRARRGTEFAEVLIKLEGHGREEDMVPGADLSRTVGWFTSAFPVRLDLNGIDVRDAFAGGPAMGSAVKAVKEQLLAIPDKAWASDCFGISMVRPGRFSNQRRASLRSASTTWDVFPPRASRRNSPGVRGCRPRFSPTSARRVIPICRPTPVSISTRQWWIRWTGHG
ncbi:hypothetical protein BJF84_16035 [Rhodococcus sp. CUA-806]|nr:hypothetical protein BJF84_16035 [Rhodococcus sp. CUA-806]